MGGSKLPDPLAATPLRPPLCPNCPALNPATPGDMGVCGEDGVNCCGRTCA